MSNLDIFNLDLENFVTKTNEKGGKDSDFYKPYTEKGKDGVYKALVRFLPNVTDPAKSKIHKYYVYLTDPINGDKFSVDCPSTVGKKSVLKDIFWKLKNSHSAADQELSKGFGRKEDYYALIQIVQDKNDPDLEGKIMIFKFGKKLNETLEAQLKPEYGEPCNPFDLFSGKLFSIHSRKVGEWNNYDLSSFVGDKCPIEIEGRKMKKTKEDMQAITAYLESGPQNLTAFEYKDWDNELTERVMSVIRNTVPDGRLVNEILGGVNKSTTPPARSESPAQSSALYEEAVSTRVGSVPEEETSAKSSKSGLKRPAAPTTASSLDDLYADL
jgi:hypothetical protein